MSKIAAPVLALCLSLFGWQAVGAEEPPKVVVVTRDSHGVQTASSRQPASFVQTARAPVYPTVVAGVSVSRPAPATAATSGAMSREQVGTMIRTAAESLEPAQMGCLVESATAGMQSGVLPRDVRSLGTNDLHWLAQRCQLSIVELAPVAAEFIASSGPAILIPTPTAQPAVPVEQKLEAMKAATAAKRAETQSSSPITATTVALLAVSLGGAMAAGVGIGQLLGRAKVPARAPSRTPSVPYRYEVSRAPRRPPPTVPNRRALPARPSRTYA
jgi:hypothetical protein